MMYLKYLKNFIKKSTKLKIRYKDFEQTKEASFYPMIFFYFVNKKIYILPYNASYSTPKQNYKAKESTNS